MNIKKISTILFAVVVSMFLYSCEGDIAETDAQIIEQISKTWTSSAPNYDMTITAGTNAGEIKMQNFDANGGITVATVSGLTITIKPQTVNGDEIYGSATIASDYTSMSFSYTVDDGGGEENYTSTFTEYVIPAKSAEKAEKVQ